MKLFCLKCESGGIIHDNERIFQYLHTFEEKDSSVQLSFWDDSVYL